MTTCRRATYATPAKSRAEIPVMSCNLAATMSDGRCLADRIWERHGPEIPTLAASAAWVMSCAARYRRTRSVALSFLGTAID